MRTLMGIDPVTALVTLQSLGADAVGCNCSGPAEMVEVIKAMKPYKVPLIVKPNAGKPRLVDGKTVFNMDTNTFCSYAEALVGQAPTPEMLRDYARIHQKAFSHSH